MTIYYLDNSAGSATSPYDTKAKAATLLSQITAIMAAGDEIRVSDNHNEAPLAVTTHTFPGTKASPCYFICIDFTTDAISTGAVISTGAGNYSLTAAGSFYAYGVHFKAGVGSVNNTSLTICNSSTSTQTLENCELHLSCTGASATINLLGGTAGPDLTLINCGVSFGATGQGISIARCNLVIDGLTLLSGSSSPVTFFKTIAEAMAVQARNINLTNASAGIDLFGGGNMSGIIDAANIKCPSGWTGDMLAAALSYGGYIRAVNVGAGDTNNMHYVEYYKGSISVDTGIYQDGVDGFERNGALVKSSHKMASNANTKPFINFLTGEWFCYPNTATTSQTATIEIIHNESAALDDDEIWIELQYPATSGSTLYTTLTDKVADYYATPAAQATSTAGWDDGLTARANSTVYSAGNIVKVASNTGRAFICTTGGTTSGSEPAGYATAADGDSITDNTATFKAMRRQKVSVTFTAAEAGPIYGRVCLGKASATVWHSLKLSVS